MGKSYKMVVLLAVLERGKSNWYDPMSSKDVAPFFHHYLMEKEHRNRIDFFLIREQRNYGIMMKKGVSKRIANMPMKKWSGSSKDLISYENE